MISSLSGIRRPRQAAGAARARGWCCPDPVAFAVPDRPGAARGTNRTPRAGIRSFGFGGDIAGLRGRQPPDPRRHRLHQAPPQRRPTQGAPGAEAGVHCGRGV